MENSLKRLVRAQRRKSMEKMEDKIREKLKEKAECVSAWLEEIRLCNEGITEVSNAYGSIDFDWPCDILVKPLDEKILEVPLMEQGREKIIGAIKEELVKKSEDYMDKITKAYQELDKLLK